MSYGHGKQTSYLEENYPSFMLEGHEGIQIHYIRKGKGQTVLLLHGWPGFWYDWRNVIPKLSEHCDVIAPDFRGFGYSGKPNLPAQFAYTPEILAKDLVCLIESLGLTNVILAAHDIGATIAQTLIKMKPEYVKGLVLLNPPYQGIGTRRFDPSMQKEFWYQHFHNLHLSEQIIGSSAENIRHYISYFYQHWIGTEANIPQNEMEKILEIYSHPGNFIASIQYYRARAGAKTADAVKKQSIISKINVKTKVLWGEEDPVIPVTWSDKLSEYFDAVSLKTLPGVGHFVPFEAPDEVVKAILEITC